MRCTSVLRVSPVVEHRRYIAIAQEGSRRTFELQLEDGKGRPTCPLGQPSRSALIGRAALGTHSPWYGQRRRHRLMRRRTKGPGHRCPRRAAAASPVGSIWPRSSTWSCSAASSPSSPSGSPPPGPPMLPPPFLGRVPGLTSGRPPPARPARRTGRAPSPEVTVLAGSARQGRGRRSRWQPKAPAGVLPGRPRRTRCMGPGGLERRARLAQGAGRASW